MKMNPNHLTMDDVMKLGDGEKAGEVIASVRNISREEFEKMYQAKGI